MNVHLVDGTYELFRHFFAVPSHTNRDGQEVSATRGVVASMLSMLEEGATHLGVATDHVVESFRNELYPGYKTGEGIEPTLLSQFPLLEDALTAAGFTVWPMIAYEADDALGSAAATAAAVLSRYEHLEAIPDASEDWDLTVRGAKRLAAALAEGREDAVLFRRIATIVRDVPDLGAVDDWRWSGPRDDFEEICDYLEAAPLAPRAQRIAAQRG